MSGFCLMPGLYDLHWFSVCGITCFVIRLVFKFDFEVKLSKF